MNEVVFLSLGFPYNPSIFWGNGVIAQHNVVMHVDISHSQYE